MKIRNIDPHKTAVLVIDMQNDFVRPGAPIFSQMGYDLAPKMADFLDGCRARGMHIVYTQTQNRADGRDMGKAGEFCEPIKRGEALVEHTEGVQIYAVVAPKEGDIVMVKHKYDSFYCTELDIILRTCGIDTVAITGVCTEACCFSTARTAGMLGYDVAFLDDMTGSVDYEDSGYGSMRAEEMHRATLVNLNLTTAHVMSSEAFLALPERK